ncbi:RNA-binding protein 25 [Drosophila elegans]|uniref:RNA-binding protein 25 n=1 Tax=Drosophila elegans TaxID=30023 RepID=UPI0007E83A19|nr:RNA-binding protein 25 [Drosophila elegans]
MNRLSEQLVEFKSKCSDYRNVVKLNVWGSDLDDIKICLEMPRLEILALSVNNINSLSSLQNCHRLKELYIRKNKIASFDELNYLTNARSLTSLWLEDNPCTLEAGGNYRAHVLRKLPQLKILDNVEVSQQEVQAALRNESEPDQKSAISAPVAESVPSTSGAKMNPCRERLEREREWEREDERQEERQRVKKLELKMELEQKEWMRERKLMEDRERERERERRSTTRSPVEPVRQDDSDAMASPFRGDDLDMVGNSFYPRNDKLLEQKEEQKRMREERERDWEREREREWRSPTRSLVQPVSQDDSDAMASPFRSDDLDMVGNSFHPRNDMLLEQKEEQKRMRERKLMEEREREREREWEREREREWRSTTRPLVRPVRQDDSDAMASPFRSDDLDMAGNSFHPRNDNLLAVSLLLIRNLDASSLKALVHAIHQQMSTMSYPN